MILLGIFDRGQVFNHGLPGWARIKLEGCAWTSQAAMDLLIPPPASLHEILKPIAHFASKMALHLFLHENEESKHRGCAWPNRRGDVLKNHPQAFLRVSFIKQIQHSRSESTQCFQSSYPCISFPSEVNIFPSILKFWKNKLT